jgi:hypothetical protein
MREGRIDSAGERVASCALTVRLSYYDILVEIHESARKRRVAD